jgi:putative membrane protein
MPDSDESESNHDGKDNEELATERTDLAEDRTVLAHERSFASWLRTGLGAVGIALGFNALFKTLEPDWVPKTIATVLLAIAIVIFVAAERRACAVLGRLDPHQVKSLRPVGVRLISRALVAATVALAAAVWLLIEV